MQTFEWIKKKIHQCVGAEEGGGLREVGGGGGGGTPSTRPRKFWNFTKKNVAFEAI